MKEIEINNQKLVTGDCHKWLKGQDDNTIDIVVTSPPYNLKINYNKYKDNKDIAAYFEWLHSIFSEVNRVMTDSGSFFLNMGGTNVNPWIPMDVGHLCRDIFTLQNHIIWIKSISIDGYTYGHFKPINSGRFLNHTFEHLFHFTKEGDVLINRLEIGVPFADKSNIKRYKHGKDLHCRGDCWHIPYETIIDKASKGKHPAIFPISLPEYCVKLAGFDKDTIVCDPFVGTGTTLVASSNLGTHGIGIDIDPHYIKFAYKRLKKLNDQENLDEYLRKE